MIRICTGFNHPYLQRAEPYLASLRIHEPERTHIFTVDFEPGQPLALDHTPVDFRKCCQVQKLMLQNGAFTLFAPAWSEADVIVFTDADAVLQRPLDEHEQGLFDLGTRDGGVMIGRNRPDGLQTLADESRCLAPRFSEQEIRSRWPGMDRMPCMNTGFVVARLSTWRKLYAEFCLNWERARACWGHYANVQWLICYCVGHYRHPLSELPLSIHAHGHLGHPPGVTLDADGIARHEGKPIFFRHVL